MRVLTLAGRLLAAALGLLLLAVVLAVLFLNPNRYRTGIEQALSAQIGRVVSIQGDMDWRLGSMLVLEIPRVQLAHPTGFTDREPFLSFTAATVRVAVWTLLRHELQLGELQLQGLRVNLQRNAAGRDNWSDLIPLFTREGDGAHALVSLAGVKLQQAEVHFVDAAIGRTFHIQDLQAQLGAFRFDQPAEIDLSMQVAARLNQHEPQWTAALQWHARLEVGVKTSRRVLTDSTMTVSELRSANAAAQTLPTTVFALRELVWNLVQDAASAQGIYVQAGTAVLNAEMQVQALSSEPEVSGRGELQIPQLRTVAQQWALLLPLSLPSTRDARVLQTLNAHLNWQVSRQAGQITLAPLRLDDTQVEGEFVWTHSASPAGADMRFQLHADHLNLDRYLSAAAGNDAGSPQPVPVQWLQQLKARGTLSIDEAQWQGLRARRFKLELDGQ